MRGKRGFLIVFGVVLLLAIIGVTLIVMPTNNRDNASPQRQVEMLALTLEWGQLAPLPNSAKNLTVMTLGNSFTRSFQVSFAAPLEAIDDWVSESSGLANLTPEVHGSQQQYLFSSNDGAIIDVMIDDSCECVVIEASSS